ncbi:hypothetical protein N658DRAFT_562570 [Parathielavia hyrcaniae]|uniref:Uncharacterized protein n=1 Tax=Parathielavia hyrcaniae TaxID=113614 RepID=A0AAN6SWB1_9PEZI|nr:hypothetical protein N658DRAFT_562570 [Parathielavia hyrcaniae]
MSEDETRNPIMQPTEDNVVSYFHLPINNMVWVEEVIARYYHEKRPGSDGVSHKSGSRRAPSKTDTVLQPGYWRGQQNFEVDSEIHARHMRPFCSGISVDPVASEPNPRSMVLFMPYLHWEPDRGRKRVAEIAKEANKHNLTSISDVVYRAKNCGGMQAEKVMRYGGDVWWCRRKRWQTGASGLGRKVWKPKVGPPQQKPIQPSHRDLRPRGPHVGSSQPEPLVLGRVERKKALGQLLRAAAALLKTMDSRTLDQAYYGEGRHAFQCLQHEIVRKSADQSIFAFVPADNEEARSPRLFAKSLSRLSSSPALTDEHFRPAIPILVFSAAGIQLSVHIAPCRIPQTPDSGSRFSVALPWEMPCAVRPSSSLKCLGPSRQQSAPSPGHDNRGKNSPWRGDITAAGPGTSAIVCGVVCLRGSSLHDKDKGMLLVWGATQVSSSLFIRRKGRHGSSIKLTGNWWTLGSPRPIWYTALYPWTPAGPGTGSPSTMDEELTDFASVQKCLARCCDEFACLAEAGGLVRHPDGSCERTWHGEGREPVLVKATIKPVVFLGREVMDITVTTAPTDGP